MNKLIGVFSEDDSIFVKRELYKISQLGYATEQLDVSSLKVKMPTPCFIFCKHDKAYKKVVGKVSSDSLVQYLL